MAVLLLVAVTVAPTTEAPETATVDLNAGEARPLPRDVPKSKSNQRQAPCATGEVEAFGLCWLELKATPPKCPAAALAHDGRCLLASEMTTRVPNTLGD